MLYWRTHEHKKVTQKMIKMSDICMRHNRRTENEMKKKKRRKRKPHRKPKKQKEEKQLEEATGKEKETLTAYFLVSCFLKAWSMRI